VNPDLCFPRSIGSSGQFPSTGRRSGLVGQEVFGDIRQRREISICTREVSRGGWIYAVRLPERVSWLQLDSYTSAESTRRHADMSAMHNASKAP
jgi:hypothetical protein